MIGRCSKNSKRGLTLPVAIVISVVLVIVAAGLVFIALSSISTTSATVNGRQAFMDLRSALEYVESYYRHTEQDYAMLGDGTGVEYFAAQETTKSDTDASKTIKYVKSKTEPVVSTQNRYDADAVRTYVEAVYSPSESGNPATLKLTGYSYYWDEFGHLGQSVSMSVTFTIGSSGSQRRVTVIDRKERIQYNDSTDTIKLNLRMPAGLDWKLCYYVWTYYDVNKRVDDKDRTGGEAYADYGKSSYYYEYEEDGVKKVKRLHPDVTKLNKSERSENQYTNMDWHEDKGTSGRMVGQSNNWFSGDYKIVKDRVNYFNVIFTSEGKVLKNDGDYNSQLNEIFHLWYLFPDDKNIFFEFLNKQKKDGDTEYYTKYYRGSGWNGRDGLDDTMIVYLRNQKTTLHFRALNDNKNAYQNEIPSLDEDKNPPTISFIKNTSDNDYTLLPSFLESDGPESECSSYKDNSGIKMTYEGCGWWVANIETKKTFNIRIVYKGVEYSYNGIRPIANMVAPDAVPEAWLVLKERSTATSISEKYLEPHVSEKTALAALGESTSSYVTIHAKNYNPDKDSMPSLSYNVNGIDSTEGRNRLYEKLVEVKVLNSEDYENYNAIFKNSGLLGKSEEAYEKEDFVQSPVKLNGGTVGPITPREGENEFAATVRRADEVYQEYITALTEGISQLVPKLVDAQTVNTFRQLLSDAKTNYYNHNELYDNSAYVTFKSVYDEVATLNVQNEQMVPKADVLDAIQRLQNQINIMKANKLDKATLSALKDEAAKYLQKDEVGKYDEDKIAQLKDLLEKGIIDGSGKTTIRSANVLIKDETITTQYELDYMETEVLKALSAVKGSRTPDASVDSSRLDSLIVLAYDKVNNTASDFTDESKSQLETAVGHAETVKSTADVTQTQISDEETKLQLAIYRFDVIKPGAKEDVASSVAEGKTRIWFNTQDDYSVLIKKLSSAGKVVEDVTKYVDSTGNTSGTASGLSCITLTDASTKKIQLVIVNRSTQQEEFSSAAFDIESLKTTDYLDIDYVGKKVTASQSTVLFVPRKIDNRNVGGTAITVKAGAAELKKATSANYYIFRIPSAMSGVSISALGKDYGSVSGVTGAGEYVVWFNGDSAKAVALDEIYPKPVKNDDTPDNSQSGKSMVAYADADYEIRQVGVGGIDASEAYQAAIKESRGEHGTLADNEMCILFKTDGEIGHGYKIYAYGRGNNGDYDETSGGQYFGYVTYNGNGYHYYIADKGWDNFIINKGDSGKDDKLEGLNGRHLPRDAKGNMYDWYLYERVDGKSGDDKYPVTQCRHKNYKDSYSVEDVERIIGSTSGDDVTVVLWSYDSETYNFQAPQINVWGDSGSFTGSPSNMYNFNGHSVCYYYQFPKTYDKIKIEQFGDGSESTLKKDDSGKLYDYYYIKETDAGGGKKAIEYIGMGNSKEHYTKEEYHSYNAEDDTGKTKQYGEGIEIGFTDGASTESRQVCIILNSSKNFTETEKPHLLSLTEQEKTADKQTTDWESMFLYKGPDSPAEQKAKYKGYYYGIFNDNYTRFSICKGPDAGNNVIIKDTDLPLNPYDNRLYKYYLITYDKNGKLWFSYYGNSAPSWKFDDTDYSETGTGQVDFTYPDIKMAYVGGGKIRVKNRSYYAIYGGAKTNAAGINLGPMSLFGGSGINDNSGNRLGDSMLLPYYDWYEYKIPVNQGEKYNFSVKGLDADHPNAETRDVKDAMGDVWVSLFNNDLSADGKKFTKAELSTFDIDVYQAPDNVTLYFKLPNGWTSMDKTAITKVHGIAYDANPEEVTTSKEIGTEENQLKRQEGIYKVTGISKHTPFIKVVYKNDSESDVRTYNIKLQGGTKVLFNPNANGGLGGWEDFISDQDDLKEVCQNLLDMYASKTIISAYTASGEIKSEAEHYESEYVEKLFTTYTNYFEKPYGSSTYKLKMSSISGLTEEAAHSAAETLRAEYDNLNTLYVLMSQARSYIDVPLKNDTYHKAMEDTSKYPEYLATRKNRTYTNVQNLKDKLAVAESAYLSDTSTSSIESAIGDLNRAIVNLRVSTEGSIAVVLYDVQDRVDHGHNLELNYYQSKDPETNKLSDPAPPISISLEDNINSEGYPIVFIDNPSNAEEKIYGVQFYDKTEGTTIGISQGEMGANEAWVYMDFKVNGEWRENSITDFRDITAEEYRQTSTEGVKFEMNKVKKGSKTVYEDMTLYFKYDTKIQPNGEEYYTIKSGAYTFKVGNVSKLPKPLKQEEEGEKVVLDLFTTEAREYFTTPENFKQYTSDKMDGKDALWWQNNNFSKQHRFVLGSNINLDVTKAKGLSDTECSFANIMLTQYYSFSTDKGIYFRWSSPQPLYVGGGGVRMYANDYRLGSVGEINAVDYGMNGTHFYLYAYDKSKDQLQISIINDIAVSYIDEKNKTHNFVIREGDYIIKKEYKEDALGRKKKTEYIADLFNESYWKSLEYVIPLDGGSDTRQWGKGNAGLSNPVYGN